MSNQIIEPVRKIYESILLPQVISIINQLPNYPEFHTNTVGAYFRRLSWGLHWQCLAVIRDFYLMPDGTERYEILEGLAPRNQAKFLGKIGKIVTRSIPDIIDYQTKRAADVKVTFSEAESLDSQVEGKRNTIDTDTRLWLFSYSGTVGGDVLTDLELSQINKCRDVLISARRTLEEANLWVQFIDTMVSEGEPLTYTPSSMWDKIEEIPQVIETPNFISNLEEYYQQGKKRWFAKGSLPIIMDKFEKEREGVIEYKGVILSSDSKGFTQESHKNNKESLAILRHMLTMQTPVLVKSKDPRLGLSLLNIAKKSISGLALSAEESEDFGIGLKGLKNKFRIESEIGNYKTKIKPPKSVNYHDWIAVEINRLCADSGLDFPELLAPEPVVGVDKLGKECFDKVMSVIEKTKAYSSMLSLESTMSKFSSFCANNHKEIVAIPIKNDLLNKVTIISGVIIKGPSNMKADTDRVNFITVEFCSEWREEFEFKYPKHHFFSIGKINVAVKLGATWNLKMHYHSTAKRCIIPVINTVNRIWFSKSSQEENLIPLDMDWPIDRIDKTITMKEWIQRVFALHYLMTLLNDSQLEAFCADIRRMHMYTRVLTSSGKQLLLLDGASPEGKCADANINNPLVAYLVKCWNSHAVQTNLSIQKSKSDKRKSLDGVSDLSSSSSRQRDPVD